MPPFCRISQIILSIYSRYAVRVIPGFYIVWCICKSILCICWGTLFPRDICWSYYYDPRCLRESPSNLAMLCIPSVMILATILESVPRCHLVVGILFLGSLTRDSPYLPHVDSVASSFRIFVTFALVLEVRGISFFPILWATYGRSLLYQKITTRVLLMSSPFYIVNLPVRPICMGCPEEMLSFARHTNLCIHNSENYMFLWVVPL